MIFADLVSQVNQDLFVDGVPENTLAANGRFFVQALNDLQRAIVCLQFGNTDVYAQCSTYFDCGLTVIPAPTGQIVRVYTIGKKMANGSNVAAGSVVGTTTVNAPLATISGGQLAVAPPTVGAVATVTSDGIYTIQVDQAMNLASAYPANSPQYFRTEINYTDTDGNPQTVQPADLIHVNVASNTGSVAISVKGGTTISYVITPFNIPFTDGGITVTMTVTAGSAADDNNDWCKTAVYEQVEYCHVRKYIHACSGCKPGQVNSSSVVNAFAASIFGKWRRKYFYPQPTDAGLQGLSPLPQGFHYPQSSTDAGGRSPGGVFAIHRGKIYIAPWIESTESVVVEWNGIKNNWSPGDLVDDDPKLYEAVMLHVGIHHYMNYEDNPARLADFKRRLYGEPGVVGVIKDLIVECRDRNRKAECIEVGTSADAAVGIGNPTSSGSGTLFYNTAQSYTANCPSGQSGNPVTVNIAAGQVSSALSVADANSQALAQAQSQAVSQLQCSSGQVFLNVAQTYTASCPVANGSTPAAAGTSVTVTIPAGQYQSTVSQAFADAAAMQAAQSSANSQLTCTFSNAPQTFQASCPSGTTGTPVSITVAAGTFTSTVSQADADSQAKASAQSQANAELTCTGITVTVSNTAQTVHIQGSTIKPGCVIPFNYNITQTVPSGVYSQVTTQANQATAQALVNSQALALAQSRANTVLQTQLATAPCAQL